MFDYTDDYEIEEIEENEENEENEEIEDLEDLVEKALEQLEHHWNIYTESYRQLYYLGLIEKEAGITVLVDDPEKIKYAEELLDIDNLDETLNDIRYFVDYPERYAEAIIEILNAESECDIEISLSAYWDGAWLDDCSLLEYIQLDDLKNELDNYKADDLER